jgi:flagellar biosynthesis protein FliQ
MIIAQTKFSRFQSIRHKQTLLLNVANLNLLLLLSSKFVCVSVLQATTVLQASTLSNIPTCFFNCSHNELIIIYCQPELALSEHYLHPKKPPTVAFFFHEINRVNKSNKRNFN